MPVISASTFYKKQQAAALVRRAKGGPVRVDVPWMTLPRKLAPPYIAEAEASHGPMHSWYRIPDAATKRHLLALSADYCSYLADEATKLERAVTRASERLRKEQKELAPQLARNFTHKESITLSQTLENQRSDENAVKKQIAKPRIGRSQDSPPSIDKTESISSEQNELISPIAAPGAEALNKFETLPFMRERLHTNPETLDAELRRWARKYLPPKLEESENTVSTLDVKKESLAVDAPSELKHNPMQRKSNMRILDKVREMQLTYDAEGVFFKVSPKKASYTLKRLMRLGLKRQTGNVIKIDWPTVRAAYGGKGFERMRAQERILRLCRGEHPETI